MNIYVTASLLLCLPAVSGQNNNQYPFCGSICNLIKNCKADYCKRLGGFVDICECELQENGCGVGGMGNAKKFLDSFARIVGGDNAPSEYFPWAVKLRPGASHCGGTFVNNDTIVTAAHCVSAYDYSPKLVEVLFGSVNASTAQRVKASRVIVHPSYTRSSQPDLAIVKLSEPVSFSSDVQPVCLPRENQPVEPNKWSLVTGWGVLTETGNTASDIMQYVSVPIVNQTQCNDLYNGGIKDGELCAGYINGGKDACKGDSGGGLVMPDPSGERWELVGIVSRGIGCARRDFPGIYSRVPSYVSWIRSNM